MRSRMMLRYLTLPCLVLACLFCANADQFSEDQAERIKSAVKSLMGCRGIHGLTLAIVNGDQTLTHGFGLADVESRAPVSANETLFCIASLTKAFTSALVAIVLPGSTTRLPKSNPPNLSTLLGDNDDCCRFADEYRNSHVTMLDLLSHRVGLPAFDLLWIKSDETREDIVRRVRYMAEVSEFRDTMEYSNIIYTMAGLVLERVTGESWESLIERHLLTPLGMTETGFIGRQPNPGLRFAKQYETRPDGELNIPIDLHSGSAAVGPSISLCSTATDMVKWMRFHLNQGRDQADHELLSEDEFLQLHEPVLVDDKVNHGHIMSPPYPAKLKLNMYGKGWVFGSYKRYPVMYHQGAYPGFYSTITMIPSAKFGIFTSVNTGRSPNGPGTYMHILHLMILDLVVENDPWLNETTLCSYPEPWEEASSDAESPNNQTFHGRFTRDAKVYRGNYTNHVLGDAAVYFSDSEEKLMLKLGRIEFYLHPFQEDCFQTELKMAEWVVNSEEVCFKVKQGRACALTLWKTDSGLSPVFDRTDAEANGVLRAYGCGMHQCILGGIAILIALSML